MSLIQQEILEGRVITEIGNLTNEEITKESLFTHDLHFDSLDMVEFAMGLEEEFEIEISDNDFAELKSVQEVIDYITKRMEEKK